MVHIPHNFCKIRNEPKKIKPHSHKEQILDRLWLVKGLLVAAKDGHRHKYPLTNEDAVSAIDEVLKLI